MLFIGKSFESNAVAPTPAALNSSLSLSFFCLRGNRKGKEMGGSRFPSLKYSGL